MTIRPRGSYTCRGCLEGTFEGSFQGVFKCSCTGSFEATIIGLGFRITASGVKGSCKLLRIRLRGLGWYDVDPR